MGTKSLCLLATILFPYFIASLLSVRRARFPVIVTAGSSKSLRFDGRCPFASATMEQKRKTRWREEWMRDRTLLSDLLQKMSAASPQELAQATGRSVGWGKNGVNGSEIPIPLTPISYVPNRGRTMPPTSVRIFRLPGEFMDLERRDVPCGEHWLAQWDREGRVITLSDVFT